MKNYKIFLISLGVIFIGSSCKKELPRNLKFDHYQYASLDEDGGTWTPVLLTAGSDIAIAAPEPITSPAYQAELALIKAEMQDISEEEESAIQYWSNNSAVRWNEIALELIAKYNLIPGPNEDDTYTLPSSASPEGPPPFPFAHPPYASRVLAYLSVAQFDGLIAAWHYKYEYNRPAPYQHDGSISYAYSDNTIPSFPSEDAVIATVSKTILSAMFPLEKTYLAELEAEHLQTLRLTGGNVDSDIAAGKIIGTEISALALSRASTDGMSKAQTNKAVADSIKAAAFARFGWQWENQELPKRGVGLTPLFGKVKMWNVPNVELTRPATPPALNSDELAADIKILEDYAANVTTERRRISDFWQDGLGTYTPPGHWNAIATSFIVKYKMNPLRAVRTLAYMNMSIMDGGISCWDTKYYYHYPRPIQIIDGFKTIAGTPNFPAYTSGHSVFSSSAAEVLAYIFPQEAAQVRAWAEEAAISRNYGGIHWTFDSKVGVEQGKNVANYTIDKAKLDGAD